MKEKCKASVHAKGCNGFADNYDHFTPKCVIKTWESRLGRQPIARDPDNLIPINLKCHWKKDQDTPTRKAILQSQIKGHGPATLAEHMQMYQQKRMGR